MHMGGLIHIEKDASEATVPAPDAAGFNLVLKCGNQIQIFTRDRFDEIPREVERLLSWGNEMGAIEIGVLEEDDPFG